MSVRIDGQSYGWQELCDRSTVAIGSKPFVIFYGSFYEKTDYDHFLFGGERSRFLAVFLAPVQLIFVNDSTAVQYGLTRVKIHHI